MADQIGGLWTHEWTYQGKVCQGGRFRRSPGLEPEGGYVDLPYEILGKLDVPQGPVWFDTGMGPKDIRTFFSGVGSRSVGQKIAAAGGGAGLAAFGDLVMTSTYKGETLAPMTYNGIFVASEGTEEITLGLSDQQKHSLGVVRVQLTDIRSTYKHGAFFGRINCRMRTTGKWVKNTTKDGKGKPWSAAEVFIFLFSELPGSPGIHPQSAIFFKDFAPPYDLVGEGEPAVEHVSRLLKHYGLTPYLLPNGDYLLGYELDVNWGQGEYAMEAGQASKINVEFVSEEHKAVSQAVTRTAACLVVGGKRRRATSFPWVPVIQDPKSLRIYPMTDENCMKYGGLSLEEVNFEVLRDPSKNFRNCEPKRKREGFLRGRMFREWAYRIYAPAIAFDTEKKGDGGLSLEEFLELPFMPMREAPWKRDDLAKHGLTAPKSKKGDVGKPGDWLLHAPVVYAAGLRQGFYKDFKAIQDYFKVLTESFKDERSRLKQLLEGMKSRSKDLDSSLLEADRSIRKNFNPGYARSQFGLTVNPLLSPGGDNGAARDLGSSVDAVQHAKDSATHGHSTKAYKDAIAAALKTVEDVEYAVGQESAAREAQKNFQKFKEVFERYGGVHAWANFPHSAIPETEYTLDEQTGLLSFARPMVRTKQPFMLQTEGAEVVADGGVMVTFGFEYNFNLFLDYTSVLFVAQQQMNGQGGPTKAVIAGLNRGSAVKPVVVRDPNIRLYENEHGTPFNATEVISAAVPHAAGQLEVPLNAVGYTYKLQGFHKASLDEGISSVQHEFDGDVAATYICVNSPGARGLPMGKPRLNFFTEDGKAIAREQVGAAQGTEGR